MKNTDWPKRSLNIFIKFKVTTKLGERAINDAENDEIAADIIPEKRSSGAEFEKTI